MTNSPNNKTATKIAAVGVVIALIGLIISIVSASRADATPPKKETATVTWVMPGSTGNIVWPQYLPGQPGAAGGGYCQEDLYKQYNDEHKAKLADILSDGRLDSPKEDGPIYLSHRIIKPGVGACPPLPTEEPTSTPTPTPTPTDEPTETPTPTPEPSVTPTPEPSVTPSATPTPEPSGTPTPQPSGTPSSSPEPSVTATSPAPSPEPSPSSTTSAPIPLPDLPPASNSAGSGASSVPMKTLAATGPEQVALLGSIALAAIIGGTMLVRRTRRQA